MQLVGSQVEVGADAVGWVLGRGGH